MKHIMSKLSCALELWQTGKGWTERSGAPWCKNDLGRPPCAQQQWWWAQLACAELALTPPLRLPSARLSCPAFSVLNRLDSRIYIMIRVRLLEWGNIESTFNTHSPGFCCLCFVDQHCCGGSQGFWETPWWQGEAPWQGGQGLQVERGGGRCGRFTSRLFGVFYLYTGWLASKSCIDSGKLLQVCQIFQIKFSKSHTFLCIQCTKSAKGICPDDKLRKEEVDLEEKEKTCIDSAKLLRCIRSVRIVCPKSSN